MTSFDFKQLRGKSFCIFGLKGTGKTYLSTYILKQFPKHLVIDVVNQYKGFNRYVMSERTGTPAGVQEFDDVHKLAISKKDKLDLFGSDETNRFCQNNQPLPMHVSDIIDFCRHYGFGYMSICRRPAQLNPNIVELADYVFVFGMSGYNDINRLNGIYAGMGDQARSLEPYHFIVYKQGDKPYIHPPIKLK